jgi:signal transduction histidine kinase
MNDEQTTMSDVMSEIETARLIEQELHHHRAELQTYEHQVNELKRLRAELHSMKLASRRLSAVEPASQLDRAMRDVIVALNQHLATNALTGQDIDPAIEQLAQEFLTEALLNIAKHSEATESNFSIKREERWLFVSVFDNGKGGVDVSQGSGLNGMQRRVDEMRGHFSISSPPGRGTLLTLAIPCGT